MAVRKEEYDWIQSWVDHADKNDLPRVLLIGDSITNGYQPVVRELLRDTCYVDHLTISYPIDENIYQKFVEMFVKDRKYDLIHFNNGLHGIWLTQKKYESKFRRIINKISNDKKVIIALTTIVYKEGNKKIDPKWNKRVLERNEVSTRIAKENNWVIDDLFTLSQTIQKDHRYFDGTHYLAQGYETLAKQVSKIIKENL